MKIRKAAIICACIMVVASLTSCGRLDSHESVQADISEMYPGSRIVSIVEETDDRDYHSITYSVEYKDIAFNIKNYQDDNFIAGLGTFKTANFSSNITDVLYDMLFNTANDKAETYGFEVEQAYDGFKLIANISSLSELEDVAKAYVDILNLYIDYLPENDISWFEFCIGLELSVEGQYACDIEDNTRNILSTDEYESLILAKIADRVRGLSEVGQTLSSQELSIDKLNTVPKLEIDDVYIDGTLVEKGMSPFIYNVSDGKYYTSVGFGGIDGVLFDYEDWTQQELISNLYPNSDYKINKFTSTSTYSIDGITYKVTQKLGDNTIKAKIGKETIEVSCFYRLGNYYKTYNDTCLISIDDFARLVNLSISDVGNGGIYFETYS